jgi:hypothetical protein
VSAQLIKAMRDRADILDQAAEWLRSHGGGWRSETRDDGHGFHLSVHEMTMQAAEYRALADLAEDPSKFEGQLRSIIASINGELVGEGQQE